MATYVKNREPPAELLVRYVVELRLWHLAVGRLVVARIVTVVPVFAFVLLVAVVRGAY
jgi:hypothetical protein